MEGMTLEQTINDIAQAFAVLQNAKADYKDRVEAAIDAYSHGCKDDLTKTDIRNIVKIAKAMSVGKKKEVEIESSSLADLIEKIGI